MAHQDDLDPLARGAGSLHKRLHRRRWVLRIQDPVELRARRPHPTGHRCLGFHRVLLRFFSPCFGRSSSAFGVFRSFLMNPWSSTARVTLDRKLNLGNLSRRSRAHIPDVAIEVINQPHADGPAVLHGFDVGADRSLLLDGQVRQPPAQKLANRGLAKKGHGTAATIRLRRHSNAHANLCDLRSTGHASRLLSTTCRLVAKVGAFAGTSRAHPRHAAKPQNHSSTTVCVPSSRPMRR